MLFAYLSKCVCAPSTADHTPQTQVNKVRSHPTLPTIVTAHEDKFIRFFDSSSGQMQHEMIAHMDAVTGIAIDPNGLYVVSASECLVCMCVVVLAHPSLLTFTYRLQSLTVTLAHHSLPLRPTHSTHPSPHPNPHPSPHPNLSPLTPYLTPTSHPNLSPLTSPQLLTPTSHPSPLTSPQPLTPHPSSQVMTVPFVSGAWRTTSVYKRSVPTASDSTRPSSM